MITLDILDADAVCQTTRPRSSSMGGELHPGHRERLRCLSPCGDVVFPSRWIAGTPATSPPSRGDSPYPPGELSAPCWPIASASPAKATFHPVRFLTITSRLLSPVDMLTPQLTRPRPWRWQQTRPEGMLGEASLGSSSWDERPPLWLTAATGLFPSLNANLGHLRRDCTMVFHGAHTWHFWLKNRRPKLPLLQSCTSGCPTVPQSAPAAPGANICPPAYRAAAN